FDQATALLSPRKGSAVRQTSDAELRAAGDPILAAIDAAVAAGLEPDAALAAAVRHRFQSLAEPEPTEAVNDGKEDA
ncbi:MAG TPA: hypothetical protein VFU81_17065, partial [Thermomicrobiales bacterium]|nr:hypothetical protein [Thermomicrobiales bacterium]